MIRSYNNLSLQITSIEVIQGPKFGGWYYIVPSIPIKIYRKIVYFLDEKTTIKYFPKENKDLSVHKI